MFYLRKIESENKRESNISLGSSYVYESKDLCNDWENRVSECLDWMNDEAKERVFAIVFDSLGHPIPLFRSDDNYIVTESGRTYAKLQ